MAKEDRVLIDVLPEDSYEREHLPGAVNFCVYETAFISKMEDAFPDKGTPLAICGFCDDTEEAAVAVERLKAAGYSDVSAVAGGLRGWKEGGGVTEGNGGSFSPEDGRLELKPGESFIRWTGRNLFNFHTGEMDLSGGFVELSDGVFSSGEVRIDMDSIRCSDLTDTKLNRMLIDHLRTDDFFDVGNHPAATLRIISAEAIADVPAGIPNFLVKGELDLRDVRHELGFPALVAWKDGKTCVAQALLDFDRTQWGSIYGSGKFFSRLGQHVVNDQVHLHVKVTFSAG